MKTKPYIRFFDFVIVLFSLDILHFVLGLALAATFGVDKEDSVVYTVIPVISLILFWTKFGLGVLFWKKIPFRSSEANASVAFRKVWIMAFFWPLLLTK